MAKKINLALPRELSQEEKIELSFSRHAHHQTVRRRRLGQERLVTHNKLHPKPTQKDLNELDKLVTFTENTLNINPQLKAKQDHNIIRDRDQGRCRGR